MFWKTLEFQFSTNLCRKMLKNGLDQDFLENSTKDLANIGNVNETNDTLPNASGHVFWKKFWIWSCGSILDDPEVLKCFIAVSIMLSVTAVMLRLRLGVPMNLLLFFSSFFLILLLIIGGPFMCYLFSLLLMYKCMYILNALMHIRWPNLYVSVFVGVMIDYCQEFLFSCRNNASGSVLTKESFLATGTTHNITKVRFSIWKWVQSTQSTSLGVRTCSKNLLLLKLRAKKVRSVET